MGDSTYRAALGLSLAALAGANAGCDGSSSPTTSAAPLVHDAFFVVSGSHASLECIDCHDTSAPTFAQAAVDCMACHRGGVVTPLHQGVDGYAAVNATCIGCHRSGTMAVAHETFFPIGAGKPHAGVACADCHGATRLAADLRCTTCHDHAQAATDARHAGLADYRWSSPACYECHRDGGVPAFAHPFPTAAGTPHAPPILCADCHGATSAAADLRCTSCHTGAHAQAATDARHAGVAGYAYRSQDCHRCHETGTSAVPANHDADFFPVTGSSSHGGLGCSQCHGATRGVADLTCIPCHSQAASAAQHAVVPSTATGRRDGLTYLNYQWQSGYCVRCHADGQVHAIADHPPVDHGISGDGHAPFCLTCHTALRTTGKTWAADFEPWSCLACHTSNTP